MHTYIHTYIHPSIHTYIHTYIQCVRVCACVVFLISSMIAGWRTHPSIPTGADVRIESCATHWSTLKRGFLDWAPWPFYLFVIVHWYSDIFRYIHRFSCNLRTKVIASIKNYTMSYPKFISGKRWKRWWARGVWWFWYIFWWNLRPTSSCGQYDATQGSTASTSPSKSNQSTGESQKTCESQKDSNLDFIKLWTWISKVIKYPNLDMIPFYLWNIKEKNGIRSLMKFGLHRDVWWCLWIGLNVSVWDELTEYSMIIIWLSYDIQ